jgi:hypothetical protein
MPRTEARIFTTIWRDEDFLALPAGAQRLYMFLLSQDDLSYCGVMPLRERRWAGKAAGLSLHDVETDLKALETAGRMFVVTDEDTGELLVRAMIRRDGAWKQPNLLKQARESAEQIESSKIRAHLLTELQRLPVCESPSEQVKTLVADFIIDLEQGKPKGKAYPEPDPSDDPPADPTGEGSANGRAEGAAKDNACARELGVRNGSNQRLLQAPTSEAPSSLPARDRKLGTYLPEPFVVTDEMKTWFRQHCAHVNARFEHDKFLDHWRGKPGKDGRKVDWVATWRNWMRNAEQRSAPRHRGGSQRQEATDEWTERALSRAQARQGEPA